MEDFKRFYETYRGKLFGYLMRSTGGDFSLSSDITQESFTRYLERYGDEQQSAPLLFTIARNALSDDRRKRKGRDAALGQNEEDASWDQEHQLMVRDDYRHVLSALEKLKKEERDVLAMVVSTDFTYREIASIAGISEANVKVKVHRARIKLRDILRKDDS
ncbi:RNA polymerase sigma factor [Thermodesulfobacteriota bacterium]